MIHPSLHKNPVPLDRQQHRNFKLDREAPADWSRLATVNSFFVNAVEFIDVCREYPIVFVRANNEGPKVEIAPVAVFGLTKEENLFVEGTQWRADYIPAELRAWPFGLAPTGDNKYTLFVDDACPTFNIKRGTPLFKPDGQPSDYLNDVQKYLETLETELARTRAFCARLVELNLMQDMRFDAQNPDGEQLTVEGFLSPDEKKFAALPDATILDLHKTGILALLHAQQVSLGNMRRLFGRRIKRMAKA